MRLDRRLFLKGLVVGAAGLMVPNGLLAEEEPERRFWSLNPTKLTDPNPVVITQILTDDPWMTAMTDRNTPMLEILGVADASGFNAYDYLNVGGRELVFVKRIIDPRNIEVVRGIVGPK